MSGTLIMRALVAVAPFTCSIVAAQYAECDPCSAVIQLDLEALSIAGTHLFCDLTCDFESSEGCAISVLPENCRACYDGDYPTSAPTEPVSTFLPTSSPTERPATIFPTSAPTERASTFPPTSSPTGRPATIFPTSAPTERVNTFPPTSSPTGRPATIFPTSAPTERPATIFPTSAPTGRPATIFPTSAPTERPATIFPTSAPTERPATIFPTSAPIKRPATISPTPSPTKGMHQTQPPAYHDENSYNSPTLEITPSPSTASSCTACDSARAFLTADDWRAITDADYELVCDPDCYVSSTLEGCGVFGLDIGCRAIIVDYGSDSDGSASSTIGTDTSDSPIVSCSAEEEARCADTTPAQQEALNSYDNGGKVIVCDPTCVDHPAHCNYFGLGPLCRGCGACSSCTPCP